MGGSNVIIRRSSIADAEACTAYMNSFVDEGLDTMPTQRYPVAEWADFIQKASTKERGFFLLAFDGPLVVGSLELLRGEKPTNCHVGQLGMSVIQSYRKQGLGRRLVETALLEVKNWPGFCRIELDVVPWNTPAIHLYESMGFVREGTKRKAADFRGEPHDLVMMALVW